MAYLEFINKDAAEQALQQLNGLKLVEKNLVAEFANIIENKEEIKQIKKFFNNYI